MQFTTHGSGFARVASSPPKPEMRPGWRLALTPAERLPADQAGNKPEHALAKHQDHTRNGGQDGRNGHDRFRAKIREDHVYVMHHACLLANDNRNVPLADKTYRRIRSAMSGKGLAAGWKCVLTRALARQ
jgi:hypothetical protein